jgi:hypothetical protein
MIRIVFPPGCYGTFLARCVFGLTNLDPEQFKDFQFDQVGSSHSLRDNGSISESVSWCHIENADKAADHVIVILPEQNHMLDYYLNQFVKQQEKHLIRHLAHQISGAEITQKLTQHWGVKISDINQVPRWVMREWFSFWVQDCIYSGYDRSRYESLACDVMLGANQLFDGLVDVMHRICGQIGLKIRVSDDIIMHQQRLFVQHQALHGHQQRCWDWCQAVMHCDRDHEILLHTIFDEAWIQCTLRQHGRELRCDGLDVFPTSSTKMKELVYPT